MVKRKKTKKAPRRRDSLARLRQTEAERRRQEEETDEKLGAQERDRLSGYGLLPSRSLRDFDRSGGRDARLALRLHPDLRDILILASRREHRTLSQLVELLLIDYAKSVMRRFTDSELRMLGWTAEKVEGLEHDPNPFGRDLYNRLKRGI